MEYLFGPVNSRRLGRSLGIDLFKEKICNFNCIYCEVGPNNIFSATRKEYTPTNAIIDELNHYVAEAGNFNKIDVLTITASGEPTLHTGIGEIIRSMKSCAGKPVVVLTNGSLLHRPEVRNDLLEADIVVPSLDSALSRSFRKVNRPVSGISPNEIIQGLETFSKDYPGEIWLEILLVKGLNDTLEDISALNQAIGRIKPDRVQLNTVARPPLEAFALPLTADEMRKVSLRIEGPVEIIADLSRTSGEFDSQVSEDLILKVLSRRPCTAQDISAALGWPLDPVKITLLKLEQNNKAIKTYYNGKEFYQTKNDSP